jgi:hypothetical protein
MWRRPSLRISPCKIPNRSAPYGVKFSGNRSRAVWAGELTFTECNIRSDWPYKVVEQKPHSSFRRIATQRNGTERNGRRKKYRNGGRWITGSGMAAQQISQTEAKPAQASPSKPKQAQANPSKPKQSNKQTNEDDIFHFITCLLFFLSLVTNGQVASPSIPSYFPGSNPLDFFFPNLSYIPPPGLLSPQRTPPLPPIK